MSVVLLAQDIGLEHMSHPPYSPDLAPSGFCLFRILKKLLRGKRFYNDNDIKQATKSYLDSMPQEFYLTGIIELFGRCHISVLLLRATTLKDKIKISASVICASYRIAYA